MASRGKELPADDETTQDSRWLNGVNRQLQPDAAQQRQSASLAASDKRKENAMSEEERKAKRALHAKEVRARDAANRAESAATARKNVEAAAAQAAAARVPTLACLNTWLANEGDDPCDLDEWDKFEEYTTGVENVAGLHELGDEDLEREVFLEMFDGWRASDEHEQYRIDNEVNELDYDDYDDYGPVSPELREKVRTQREPSPPPPDDDDPYGGGSADMFYDKPGDETPPRDEVPAGMSIDDEWDKIANLEYLRREREAEATSRRNAVDPHEQRKQRELAAGPPPRREHAKYGPRGDAAGDEIFRADREKWYACFTGRSIADATLQEQNEVCDAIARRFREYTDGRPA